MVLYTRPMTNDLTDEELREILEEDHRRRHELTGDWVAVDARDGVGVLYVVGPFGSQAEAEAWTGSWSSPVQVVRIFDPSRLAERPTP